MYIYSIQKALIQVKLKDCLQIKFMEIKKKQFSIICNETERKTKRLF